MPVKLLDDMVLTGINITERKKDYRTQKSAGSNSLLER
jgi:hypothetical protein